MIDSGLRQCYAEYERPGGRERGDRIVRCGKPQGHDGDHEELDTGSTWPRAVPTHAPESFTEEDVQLVARYFREERYRDPEYNARDVLTDLAKAGRLLLGRDRTVGAFIWTNPRTGEKLTLHPADVIMVLDHD